MKYIVIMALSFFTFSMQAQYAESLRQQYNNFLYDMQLVKKCYWQKLPCSQKEKEKADRIIQAGLLGGGAVALIGGYKGIGLLANQYRIKEATKIVKQIIPDAQDVIIVRHKYPYGAERERIIVTVPQNIEKNKVSDIVKALKSSFAGMGFSLQTSKKVIYTTKL